MEQVIFLIVIAVIAFLNWLFRESGLFGNKPEEDETAETRQAAPGQRRGESQTPEQDQIRRFLEALGAPEERPPPVPGSQQPPPLEAEPAEPRRQPVQVHPPAYDRTDQEKYQRTDDDPYRRPSQAAADRAAQRRSPRAAAAERMEDVSLSKAEQAALERLEQAGLGDEVGSGGREIGSADPYQRDHGAYRIAPSEIGEVDVRWLLESTEGLRKAIILREIIDRPIGLQLGYEPATFSRID